MKNKGRTTVTKFFPAVISSFFLFRHSFVLYKNKRDFPAVSTKNFKTFFPKSHGFTDFDLIPTVFCCRTSSSSSLISSSMPRTSLGWVGSTRPAIANYRRRRGHGRILLGMWICRSMTCCLMLGFVRFSRFWMMLCLQL